MKYFSARALRNILLKKMLPIVATMDLEQILASIICFM